MKKKDLLLNNDIYCDDCSNDEWKHYIEDEELQAIIRLEKESYFESKINDCYFEEDSYFEYQLRWSA